CGHRRHDPPLPRSEIARPRLGKSSASGGDRDAHKESRAHTLFISAAASIRSMKPLRVLMLCHPQLIPPATLEGYTDKEILYGRTESDVLPTLSDAGHQVRVLGVQHELQPIRDEIEKNRPDIVFNLLNEFQGDTLMGQNVVSFLELLRIPYTGCNPRGM